MIKKLLVIAMFAVWPLVALAKEPAQVSLLQLIVTPERFHGRIVRVEGYLHHEFEDSALYLTKEDADHLIGRNSVWLSYPEQTGDHDLRQIENDIEKLDFSYVLIEGTFNMNSHGHMGSYAGEVKKVTRVMKLTKWYDGKRQLKK